MAKAKKKVVKKAASKKAKVVTKAKKVAKTARSKVLVVKKAAKRLEIGQKVPDFKAPATGGQEVSLSALQGRKVVLFFYPKDMTPGCTIEGHEFTRLKPQFEAKNTVVFGISRDTMKSHEKFKEKECYTIDLLSDENENLCATFGVMKDKNMYGKMVRGIERSTFVIDENGRLVNEWRGVKAEGHAAQVLAALTP
jgi:thioredoxin-dependent peroxiredoxin